MIVESVLGLMLTWRTPCAAILVSCWVSYLSPGVHVAGGWGSSVGRCGT
jgi:hypothetical protein